MVIQGLASTLKLQQMLLTAILNKSPAAIRYPRGIGEGVPLEKDVTPLPLGKAEILSHGDDVLILAIGRMVGHALAAQKILLERKIETTVVNCRFVKPFDSELIGGLAKKIPRIITLEENILQGGFSSAVLENLADQGINSFNIRRLGIRDTFVEHGPQDVLLTKYGLDRDTIVRTVEDLLKQGS